MANTHATGAQPQTNLIEKPSAADNGRALRGFGINILVSDVTACCRFTAEILVIHTVYQDDDISI